MCLACGKIHYLNPAAVAVCIVQVDGGIVLVRRKNEPGFGLWGLPGGFIDHDEDVEDAARREVLEEIGLRVRLDALVAVISYFQPGKNGLAVFYSATPIGGVLTAGDDAEIAQVFPLDSLPPLAFESHQRAVERFRQIRAQAAAG